MLVIDPFHPKTHYELALSYNNMGNCKKAIEHMNIAVDIWKQRICYSKRRKRNIRKLALKLFC